MCALARFCSIEDAIPITGERYVYATTTIPDAWGWEWAGSLAALSTTLCCLGFPALVGLISALGAGFLLRDSYLEPSLSGTFLVTVQIAGLHLRRHHQPGPFLLSLVAAGSVFFAIYGIGLLPHAFGGASMADGMAAPLTWSPYLAYGAILVLLGAQIWDLWLYRRCVSKAAPVPMHSALASPERRKEGV